MWGRGKSRAERGPRGGKQCKVRCYQAHDCFMRSHEQAHPGCQQQTPVHSQADLKRTVKQEQNCASEQHSRTKRGMDFHTPRPSTVSHCTSFKLPPPEPELLTPLGCILSFSNLLRSIIPRPTGWPVDPRPLNHAGRCTQSKSTVTVAEGGQVIP